MSRTLTVERFHEIRTGAQLRLKARSRRAALAGSAEPFTPLRIAALAGYVPDDWQRDVLTATDQQMILLCSRQSGKSQTLSWLALATALAERGCLVLILSATQRQSAETMGMVQAAYRAFDPSVRVETERESALHISLAGGSRIIALPGSKPTNVRGYPGPRLVIIDEAAFIPDALFLTLRPMLAVSHGRLVMASTPFGKRGVFYTEWSSGDPSWRRFEIPATRCPRISAEFLAEEETKYGRRYVEREYLCVFHQADDVAFNLDAVDLSFADAGVEPLFADLFDTTTYHNGHDGSAAVEPLFRTTAI